MMNNAQTFPSGKDIIFSGDTKARLFWNGSASSIAFNEGDLRDRLLTQEKPILVISHMNQIGLPHEGVMVTNPYTENVSPLLASVPPLTIDQLDDPGFEAAHKTRYAYYAGAMANGIASEKMVITLRKAGLLGSFGLAGLVPTASKPPLIK